MDSNQLLGRYKQNISQQRRQNRRERRAARRGGDTSTFGGNDVNGGDQMQYAGGSPNFNENTGQPFGYMPDRFKRPDGDQMKYKGGTPGFYDRISRTPARNGFEMPPMTRGGGMMGDPYYYGGRPDNQSSGRGNNTHGIGDFMRNQINDIKKREAAGREQEVYEQSLKDFAKHNPNATKQQRDDYAKSQRELYGLDKQQGNGFQQGDSFPGPGFSSGGLTRPMPGFEGGSPTASNMMAPEPEGNTSNAGPAYNRRVRGQSNNPNASEGGQGEGQGGQGQGQGGEYTNPGSGYMNFQNIMEQMYGYKPSPDDDEGRAMKNAFGYDMMSKFFDSMLSRGMGQYQAGLSKDMMNHSFTLEQLGLSNSRKEEFGYGMRAMDKQYELQNLFANQQYGRDLGQLAATGEQTRKNYESMGVQNRLQTITEGEQNRLGYAAQGDQDRKGYRVLGDEERKTMGDQDRYARGQMKLGSTLKRDEMGDANKYAKDQIRVTGRQERKNIGARGEQERLNIGKRGDESRKSYEFEDRIDARQEQRERSRSKAQARAF